MINFENMATETRNSKTLSLDTMSALEIVTAMNQEDSNIPPAINKVLPSIATVVEKVRDTFLAGGRLIYMGAGTSGRLGVLDASECPPTFGVSPDMVIGLIAGGDYALRNAAEGAEDDKEAGRTDLIDIHLEAKDIVIGIAASGRTPYCIGGLNYAAEIGCETACVVCNLNSAMAATAKHRIEVIPGPEVLTGSTRLKAGTSQKLVLNMITTGAMVLTGKAYENLMVDMIPSNEKLFHRAENIVCEATGVDVETAKKMMKEGDGTVKTAIVMILADCDVEEAKRRLSASKGHVRGALEEKIDK